MTQDENLQMKERQINKPIIQLFVFLMATSIKEESKQYMGTIPTSLTPKRQQEKQAVINNR